MSVAIGIWPIVSSARFHAKKQSVEPWAAQFLSGKISSVCGERTITGLQQHQRLTETPGVTQISLNSSSKMHMHLFDGKLVRELGV